MIKSTAPKLLLWLALTLPLTAQAAHPFATEDAQTLGKGSWQLELNTDSAYEKNFDYLGTTLNATLSYGLSENWDIAFNAPWERFRSGEEANNFEQGLGDISLALKWKAYEDGKLSLALKPALFLPSNQLDKEQGTDKLIPSLTGVSTWGDQTLEWQLNIGYAYNSKKDERQNLWNASAAVHIKLTDTLKLGTELGAYSSEEQGASKHPVFANVGLIYSPNEQFDFDFGYRRGLNDAENRHSFGAGVTMHW